MRSPNPAPPARRRSRYMKNSHSHSKALFVSWVVVVAGASASTMAVDAKLEATKSLAPAKTPASAGLVNDWLRKEWPDASEWDIGGQFRVRYEVRENGGLVSNRDFLEGTDNSNDFFLFRTKVHLGWSPETWVTLYAEGRDSHDASDRRAVKETDTFDLYQAYVRLGDPKQFPVSLKIGRQEMLYGDERYIGVSDWSNTGRSFDAAKLRFENESFWVDVFAGRVVLSFSRIFNRVTPSHSAAFV